MEWTAEQRKAIDERGKNIIVSASAGSGKTTVMVERILSLVREGASLDRMLISTFTKSSAADMREKMYNSLSAQSENEHIRKQLEILPQADITNLHSWYQRIIKKYFYALGIDPAFEILEEDESNAVLCACLDEVIEKNLANGNEEFLKLYESLRTSRKDSSLRNYILRIYRFSMTRSDPDEWLSKSFETDPKKPFEILKKEYSEKKETLSRSVENLSTLIAEAGFKRNFQATTELRDYLDSKTDTLTKLSGKIPEEFTDLNDMFVELKASVVKWRNSFDELKTLPTECALSFKTELVRLVLELKNNYIEEKISRSLMDFNDLEHICEKLLTSSVGETIIDSYDYVFVDEYQDINPLQEKILNCLAKKSEMFYVGDIKQSIYAFRGCEPAIFLDRYERYKRGEGGIGIDFNDNFRSCREITDFCNSVMASRMTKTFGGIDYEKEAMLKSSRKEKGEVSAYMFTSETKENAEEQREEKKIYNIADDDMRKNTVPEAVAAANYILNLVEKKVEFGDIAVLARGVSESVNELKKELSARGIPYVSSGESSFCNRGEIMPVISFMKTLNNFRDEINLVAVMRSVFGGFSDEELAQTALLPGANFYEKTLNYSASGIGKKLKEFGDKLKEYYEYSRFHTIYETVNKLIYEHNYFKYLFASGDIEAPEVLNAFLEHLSGCKYAVSLNEYLTYIENSSPVYEPAEKSDAVKIMTVHKSKGLEFPHVVYYNVSHSFSKKDYILPLIIDDEGLHLKNWNEETHKIEDTIDWRMAQSRMKKRRCEEELRLLYVALTRAKDSLAIFGMKKKDIEIKITAECSSALDFLSPTVDSVTREFTLREIASEAKRVLLLQTREGEDAAELRQRWESNRHSDRHERKSYVTKISEGTDSRQKLKNSASKTEFSGSEAALLKGTLYHEFMENLDFSGDFAEQWQAFPADKRVLADAEEIRVAFDTIRELTSGKSYLKELPFTYNAPAEYVGGSSGTVIVQGVIDLLIDNGDSFTVVDYKTTRGENILNEAYKTQLKIYSEAVEKVLGKKVKSKYIYSFKLKRLFEI